MTNIIKRPLEGREWKYDIVKSFTFIKDIIFPGVDLIIAGGSVNKAMHNGELGNSDIDIFFTNIESYKQAEQMARDQSTTHCVSTHPNCNSFTITKKQYPNLPMESLYIQLIKKSFHPTVDELFAYFDFTVCQYAFIDGNWLYTNNALRDTNNKKLHYIGKQNNERSATRFHKYLVKGYEPTIESFNKFFLEGDSFTIGEYEISDTELLYGSV